MARLSDEHFKDNPAVPARRKSRFKEIFKHRQPSSSDLGSSKTLIKVPPVERPLVSPTMKPGFERVGLLPSERESLETAAHLSDSNDGKAGEAIVAKDVRSTPSVDIPHQHETGSDMLTATHMNKITERMAEEENLGREGSIEHSLKEALFKHQNEDAKEEVDLTEGLSIPCASASFAGTVPAMNTRDFAPHEFREQNPVDTAHCLGHESSEPDSTFVTVASDRRSSHDMSLVSNIFDNHDSLSQGIREYVASKIAEALVEQERQRLMSTQAMRSAPLSGVSDCDISGFAERLGGIIFNQEANQICLFTSPKRIGPLTIDHPRIATDLQIAIIGAYVSITLVSALVGPKIFFLTSWRLGVFLSLYGLVVRHFKWMDDMQSDMVLSPICYLSQNVRKTAGKALHRVQKSKRTDFGKSPLVDCHNEK